MCCVLLLHVTNNTGSTNFVSSKSNPLPSYWHIIQGLHGQYSWLIDFQHSAQHYNTERVLKLNIPIFKLRQKFPPVLPSLWKEWTCFNLLRYANVTELIFAYTEALQTKTNIINQKPDPGFLQELRVNNLISSLGI